MDEDRLPQMYAGLRACPAGLLLANGLGGVCPCPVVRQERVRVLLTAPSYGFTRTIHPSGIQLPGEIRQVSDYHRRTSRPQARGIYAKSVRRKGKPVPTMESRSGSAWRTAPPQNVSAQILPGRNERGYASERDWSWVLSLALYSLYIRVVIRRYTCICTCIATPPTLPIVDQKVTMACCGTAEPERLLA